MKIAVTGKGGVGKSTLAALMARIFRDRGHRVLVVDADPDMNLAGILGIPDSRPITPIIEYKELIARRTGTEVDKPSPFFKMNPEVDDIPDRYCLEHEGIKLMVMGTVHKGGGGCACPVNAFLKQLLAHLVLLRDEVVILDMEAGIEHLGRGTALGVDQMVVVVEPSRASIDTARRIQRLAGDIGIKHLRVMGNKTHDPAERQFILDRLKGFDIMGFVDYFTEFKEINLNQATALSLSGKPVAQLKKIMEAKWLKT